MYYLSKFLVNRPLYNLVRRNVVTINTKCLCYPLSNEKFKKTFNIDKRKTQGFQKWSKTNDGLLHQTRSLLQKFTKLLTDKPSLTVNNFLLFSDGNPQKPYKDYERSHKKDDKHEKSELPGDDPDKSPNANLIRILAVVGLVLFSLFTGGQDTIPETSWPVFLRLMLQKGEVEKLEVSSTRDRVYVYLARGAIINGREVFGGGPQYSFSINSVQSFEKKLKEAQENLGIPSNQFLPVKYAAADNQIVATLINAAITIGLLGAIAYFAFGRKSGASGGGSGLGGNPFSSHTRAKATIILPGTRSGIGFKDVAGMREAKEEVREFVDYLQYPTRFKELGAKIPKGALLCGSPGTGKTLLAKAVATEAAVPFLSMAGSDFVEMFSGVGSARVRDLFEQAKKRAPCIVYIDEIDAIGRSRRSSSSSGGNSEQENTLNQLLVEMDGMNTVEGIVMLASTNRPDILDSYCNPWVSRVLRDSIWMKSSNAVENRDLGRTVFYCRFIKALMRPGRFDRQIEIDLPTLPERQSIFELYLKTLKLGDSIKKYSKRLAELTPGKSGADIANICNEAALHAARLNADLVDDNNFEYAIERVIAGIEKRNNPLSPEERRMVAYHEAGHALTNWLLKYTEPVLKVSIVPRTSSPLGYTQKFPLDTKLHTNEQLFDMMCSSLGGRVAEAIVFERLTTAANDDLDRVTQMAYQQIVTFGMNERVGPISFRLKKQNEMSRKPYSDKLAKVIDEEASSMVTKANRITKELLIENKEKLEIVRLHWSTVDRIPQEKGLSRDVDVRIQLAEALLEKEVLNYADLEQLLGPPPYGDKRDTFYKYAFKPRKDSMEKHADEASTIPS